MGGGDSDSRYHFTYTGHIRPDPDSWCWEWRVTSHGIAEITLDSNRGFTHTKWGARRKVRAILRRLNAPDRACPPTTWEDVPCEGVGRDDN